MNSSATAPNNARFRPDDSAAKTWDEVRAAFASSILVDTPLNSLAQNLEGPDWPIKSKSETPANYVDLTFDEVVELLALKGQPAACVNRLIEILKDTLAFDAPFGDMVVQSEASAAHDNVVLKNLSRLEIPVEYPVALTALAPETIEFCKLEHLRSLGEFAIFAQGMSQSVIVGGDFRTLLNALSHVDESTLARFLPFRPGVKGLHLIEGLAIATQVLTPAERLALARHKGALIPSADATRMAQLSRDELAAAQVRLQARADQFLAHFSEALPALQSQCAAPGGAGRLLMVLNDPIAEALVAALLASSPRRVDSTPPIPLSSTTAKPTGWRGLLQGLFRT